MKRRFRLYRWLRLFLRKPTRPKCLVHIEWGEGDLGNEMIGLDFIPRIGDQISIEIRDTADDSNRWRVEPKTVRGTVSNVQHNIHIDYGNDVGPDSYQDVLVLVSVN